jgi:serine/threonine protein kinase
VDAHLRRSLLDGALEGASGIRYRLRELIGEGGQGWVFKASVDTPAAPTVVVKVLQPEGVQEEALYRFQREGDVLRMLGALPSPCPHIVRFHDYGVHTIGEGEDALPVPFLVVEHIVGQTLGKVIAAHGGFGMPVARARRIMGQVALGLHALHEMQIVHRDLKPSNILLAQENGQEIAKITDYGLVKLVDDTSAFRTTGFAGASLGYAPPEQYEMGNRRVGAQTDVFSFAAILYEVLCGTEAFPCGPGDNPVRMIARMMGGERPSLARVQATVHASLRDRPDLVAALDREIARAIHPEPMQRHSSIRDLWQAVEPLLREAVRPGSSASIDDPISFDALPRLTSGADIEPAPPALGAPPTVVPTSSAPSGVAPVAAPMPAWRSIGPAIAGERLRAALLVEEGRAVVAAGARGLYRLVRGSWSPAPLPPAGAEPRFVRGLVRLASGEILLYGDAGLCIALSSKGVSRRIVLPDRDVVLLGAHADDLGVVLVGERLSRPVGVVAVLPRDGAPSVRTVEGTTRLLGVARLGDDTLVACGMAGALVEIGDAAGARALHWGRTGHLYAMSGSPSGAVYAVGSGGHALSIKAGAAGAPPLATLESVQTTRDLTSVTADRSGAPWAAGAAARLLQRRDGVWTRIPLDPSVTGALVIAAPHGDVITVVAEDGSTFEGRVF